MDNLFKDYKHNKDFLSLIHYKLGYKLYDIINHKNHPNLIISGINNSGKTLLIKTIMNDIYDINKTIRIGILYDNISYEYSNIHYYFNIKSIQNYDKLLDYLKKIINGYNYYTDKCNYIILDNFETIPDMIQNKLRVILEKSSWTCKIIIITNKYNKIIDPLKSRFINIRIPSHKTYDKFIYFKQLFQKNLFIIDDDILLKIIHKHDNIDFNFINILGYFKTKQIHGDVYDEIINKYMIIIKSNKNIHNKICDIKQLLYLSKSVIDVDIFLKRLLSQLLKLDYDNNQKSIIVKEFTEYDIMINKSFRDLLCLEGLLINILTHSSS
jgi:DNA polymerase III delta prime subunit